MITKYTQDKKFESEVFVIQSCNRRPLEKILCRWKFSDSCLGGDALKCFRSVDLLLNVLPDSTNKNDDTVVDATGTTLEVLLCSLSDARHALTDKTATIVKIILVPHEGYLCRSDILNLRMSHSEYVDQVISFATWDRLLPSMGADDGTSLLSLLSSSPGALLVKQSHESLHDSLDLLQQDLNRRLSFNWLLPKKPAARRVAVIGGRPFPDRKRGIYGSQGFFQAARALGISMIVFDEPGHWLEENTYAHLREEFVPMDMNDLAGLPQRLALALSERHVDGITTFMDTYVIATAEAAELLKLPTEPARAMRQAHFKHKMRKVVNDTNVQAITVNSIDQLDDPTMTEILGNLQYPLIVKPCRGRVSENVKKVSNEDSMRRAVRMLLKDGSAKHGILVETYVDGPELDANFMLWDGQVLFLEVTDNFPCAADASNATLAEDFRETVQISNSRLPPDEIEIIRSSILRSLLKLGFRSGVFHVEARMQNSSMRYQDIRGDGILDLAISNASSNKKPEVFVVEINVRPPGTGGTWATLLTYGVDQGALQFLRALDDSERFEALSKPFVFPEFSPGDGGGSQFWTAQCLIPIHREHILVPDDLFERVYQALPELLPFVLRAEMYAQVGTIVSPIKGIGWIGYAVLFSRLSRSHVLEMYHRLAKTCMQILDEDL